MMPLLNMKTNMDKSEREIQQLSFTLLFNTISLSLSILTAIFQVNLVSQFY